MIEAIAVIAALGAVVVNKGDADRFTVAVVVTLVTSSAAIVLSNSHIESFVVYLIVSDHEAYVPLAIYGLYAVFPFLSSVLISIIPGATGTALIRLYLLCAAICAIFCIFDTLGADMAGYFTVFTASAFAIQTIILYGKAIMDGIAKLASRSRAKGSRGWFDLFCLYMLYRAENLLSEGKS